MTWFWTFCLLDFQNHASQPNAVHFSAWRFCCNFAGSPFLTSKEPPKRSIWHSLTGMHLVKRNIWSADMEGFKNVFACKMQFLTLVECIFYSKSLFASQFFKKVLKIDQNSLKAEKKILKNHQNSVKKSIRWKWLAEQRSSACSSKNFVNVSVCLSVRESNF